MGVYAGVFGRGMMFAVRSERPSGVHFLSRTSSRSGGAIVHRLAYEAWTLAVIMRLLQADQEHRPKASN